jgi:UDP-glucose 4-epimerase
MHIHSPNGMFLFSGSRGHFAVHIYISPLLRSICEQQASAVARRYPNIRIASLRFHWIIPSRTHGNSLLDVAGPSSALFAEHSRDLWGWVSQHASARACILGLTAKEGAWTGHEAFFVVAPNTVVDTNSEELCHRVYPEVKDVRRPWTGNLGFFDCKKAANVLGWQEDS